MENDSCYSSEMMQTQMVSYTSLKDQKHSPSFVHYYSRSQMYVDTSSGNENILLTERGTSFGYDLVSDMTAIPTMQTSGYPVIFDATHSSQVPGVDSSTGGQREMIPVLAKSAVAAGCDGLFMEVHDNPDKALSDGTSSLHLDDLTPLLKKLKNLYEVN